MVAVITGFFLAGPTLAISRHIPLNYNEGWNAYLARRAIGLDPAPLYLPPGSLVFNNYPPLSFYLVGALGRFVLGDMILAGRIVALASLLTSAALLTLCLRRFGAAATTAASAGLLLLLFATTFCREYIAMDDPQWLGHALMLAGLAALLRQGPQRITPAAAIPAALLMLAGGFVKHNLVALPLATTLWLLIHHRATGLAFLATATLALAAGIAATLAVHGPNAWMDILHSPRIYSPAAMLKGAGRLAPLLPMAALALWALSPRRHDPAVHFVALLVPIALVTGIAQRAGAGVAINAIFETLVATCLAFGLALDRPRPALLFALACLPVLLVLPQRATHAWADLTQAKAREAAWHPIIARLAIAPAPVACEMLSLCYWAGQPETLDLFNLTQSLRTGRAMPDLSHLTAFEYQSHSPIPPLIRNALPPALHPVLTGPQTSVVLAR